jgi:AMP deaminase
MMTAEQEQEIYEQTLSTEEDNVVLSTHDQAMEVMMREIDAKREKIRVAKIQVDALKRQHRSLVDNLTEVGARRQRDKEEEELRANIKKKVDYERYYADEEPFETPGERSASRLLVWKPLPPDSLQTSTRTAKFSRRAGRALPAPPTQPHRVL